jgi:hypothetical protein
MQERESPDTDSDLRGMLGRTLSDGIHGAGIRAGGAVLGSRLKELGWSFDPNRAGRSEEETLRDAFECAVDVYSSLLQIYYSAAPHVKMTQDGKVEIVVDPSEAE